MSVHSLLITFDEPFSYAKRAHAEEKDRKSEQDKQVEEAKQKVKSSPMEDFGGDFEDDGRRRLGVFCFVWMFSRL